MALQGDRAGDTTACTKDQVTIKSQLCIHKTTVAILHSLPALRTPHSPPNTTKPSEHHQNDKSEFISLVVFLLVVELDLHALNS